MKYIIDTTTNAMQALPDYLVQLNAILEDERAKNVELRAALSKLIGQAQDAMRTALEVRQPGKPVSAVALQEQTCPCPEPEPHGACTVSDTVKGAYGLAGDSRPAPQAVPDCKEGEC